jgi:predicted ATPase
MNQYEAARNGLAHVVLLSGEAGIGKTSILDEIARRASQDGATVLRGGSSQAEGMPPYLPFLEALGRYVQDCPVGQLETQSAATSQSLVALLPELATRLGNLPASYPSPPEQARFRLYEAIGTFLQSIGAPHILVLIFDDLHWADSASLDLLSHVMRRQRDAHLLVLGAYRDSEINQNAALGHLITELSRQRTLTTIPIGPFSGPEIEALAERARGGFLSPDVSRLLYNEH